MVRTNHITADQDVNWRATSRDNYYGFGRPFARISWGSIFAGAVVSLAIQLVLTLIGTAIGLATLNPATGDSPSGTSLGIGAAVWLVVSSLIALFAGGYVAGRLGGTFNGWLHGLATWATVTTATLILLATAAGGLAGAVSGLGAFAINNSDKMSRAELPPAVQQQIDQLAARARQSADQATTQPQSTTPEQRETQAGNRGDALPKEALLARGQPLSASFLGQ